MYVCNVDTEQVKPLELPALDFEKPKEKDNSDFSGNEDPTDDVVKPLPLPALDFGGQKNAN